MFDPVSIALTVAFVLAFGYGLYLVMPEQEHVKTWIEKFNEYQQRKAAESAENVKPNSIASRLKRAGINLHPIIFYAFCVQSASLVAVLVANYTKNIPAGLIISVIGFQVPIWLLNLLNHSYDKKMDMQIELLISSTAQTIMSSGSMIKTLENATRILDDPLRSELMKILGGYRLGKPLEKGFIELANRTGHIELKTYARIVNIAMLQGTSAAADSFRRLHRVVEQQESLRKDRKAQLAEYTMFVLGLIVGLPVAYVIACSMSPMAYESLINWFPGKIATVGIALMIVGSYLGYNLTTR